jgi:hypothetical protein
LIKAGDENLSIKWHALIALITKKFMNFVSKREIAALVEKSKSCFPHARGRSLKWGCMKYATLVGAVTRD